MRKDRTIISELQDFFLQNDAHLATNSISDVMSCLKLHKNKIGQARQLEWTAFEQYEAGPLQGIRNLCNAVEHRSVLRRNERAA